MLNENSLLKYFWAEAVNTACYVLNRVLIRLNLNKTPYEFWKDKKPNISYFKAVGCIQWWNNLSHSKDLFVYLLITNHYAPHCRD